MNDNGSGDVELRSMLAREAVQLGRLPARPADRVSNHHCGGARCAVCQLPLMQGELGCQLEFAQNGRYGPAQWLHTRCFDAWQDECRRTESDSDRVKRHGVASKPGDAT